MEKYNKIHWAKGLDITPEVFVGSDNYHIAERKLIGRFVASRLYGIIPDKKFYIRKRIDTHTNTLFIDNLECMAITHDGYVINLQSDMLFSKEVSLKNETGTTLYMILTVNPYSTALVDDEKLHVYPKYDLMFKRPGEAVETGMPVLKICYDIDKQCWKIDENYIPPSIALGSVDELKQLYIKIKDKLNHIIEKLSESDTIYVQAMLLKLELENDYLQKSPQELTLLLKKICLILKLYIRAVKNIKELPVFKKFIDEQYNHNDIEKSLRLGFESLVEIDQKIDEKPIIDEPEIIEIEIKI